MLSPEEKLAGEMRRSIITLIFCITALVITMLLSSENRRADDVRLVGKTPNPYQSPSLDSRAALRRRRKQQKLARLAATVLLTLGVLVALGGIKVLLMLFNNWLFGRG